MRSAAVSFASVPFLLSSLFVAQAAQAEIVHARLVPAPASQANAASRRVDVSANGKVVAFDSLASNWHPGFPSPNDKIVVVDLAEGIIDVVSSTTAGVAITGVNPSLSRDGRYVTFANLGGNLDVGVPTSGWQIVRKDRVSGQLRLVSANAGGAAADRESRDASISGDGNVVVFRSWATNLGVDAGGYYQVFAKSLSSGAIVPVSVRPDGSLPNVDSVLTPHAISDNGRYVVFTNNAAMVTGVNAGTTQVFLRDLQAGTNELVSRNTVGEAGNSLSDMAAISPSGRFVSFRSFASNMGGNASTNSGVFVRDRTAGTTQAVPKPSLGGTLANGCRESAVSDIGTVLMACTFPAPTKDQVFLHLPGAAGTPFLVSGTALNVPGNDLSGSTLAVDASGLSMVYESLASNLDPADSNAASDIFVLVDTDLLDGIFADGFED